MHALSWDRTWHHTLGVLPTYLPTYQHIHKRTYTHSLEHLDMSKHALCMFFEILIFLDNFWLPSWYVGSTLSVGFLKF